MFVRAVVPAGQLWAGVPAAFVRVRSDEEIAQVKAFVDSDLELAQVYTKVGDWFGGW